MSERARDDKYVAMFEHSVVNGVAQKYASWPVYMNIGDVHVEGGMSMLVREDGTGQIRLTTWSNDTGDTLTFWPWLYATTGELVGADENNGWRATGVVTVAGAIGGGRGEPRGGGRRWYPLGEDKDLTAPLVRPEGDDKDGAAAVTRQRDTSFYVRVKSPYGKPATTYCVYFEYPDVVFGKLGSCVRELEG